MVEETVPSCGSPSELPYSELLWVWGSEREVYSCGPPAGHLVEEGLEALEWEAEQGVRVSGFS